MISEIPKILLNIAIVICGATTISLVDTGVLIAIDVLLEKRRNKK